MMVHVPLMFLSEWREFPSASCLAGKNLMTARVSMLLKTRASPEMLPFSLCNKKRLAIRHFNRPFFPTTLSIPSYDMGKYVGLRTYQHPSYNCFSGRINVYVFKFKWLMVKGMLQHAYRQVATDISKESTAFTFSLVWDARPWRWRHCISSKWQ